MTWLLSNWRLVAVLAIVAALGVQTFRLQDLALDYEKLDGRFTVFRLAVETAGKVAAAEKQATDAHNDLIREELDHDIQTQREERARERADSSDRFAALYVKYHGLLNAEPSPGGGAVSQAGGGAADAVRAVAVRLDGQRLAAALRRDLGALYSELEPLVRRGEDGLDDQQHWGRWARLVGVCPEP